jgi:predicted amidophosphoribosyltransferase
MFAKLISGALQQGLKLSALPSQCRVCHAWPSQPVCEACVSQFAQPHPRCISCALPLPAGMRHCGTCLKNPPPLDRCLAAVAYAYPWQTLIQDYKCYAPRKTRQTNSHYCRLNKAMCPTALWKVHKPHEVWDTVGARRLT